MTIVVTEDGWQDMIGRELVNNPDVGDADSRHGQMRWPMSVDRCLVPTVPLGTPSIARRPLGEIGVSTSSPTLS